MRKSDARISIKAGYTLFNIFLILSMLLSQVSLVLAQDIVTEEPTEVATEVPTETPTEITGTPEPPVEPTLTVEPTVEATVEVTEVPAALPNLVLWPPEGWESPIVISTITGTHVNDTLTAGEDAFVDLAVLNDGQAIADAFSICLTVDESPAQCWNGAALEPGAFFTVEDWLFQEPLEEGTHIFTLVLDAANTLLESNETDNTMIDEFIWNSADVEIEEDPYIIGIINSPPYPPADFNEPAVEIFPQSAILLNVPAYEWVFGCSAVSAAMIAGYYDNNGFPNIYTGPTNGGKMPTTDNAWSFWSDGYRSWPNNPLIASHNGVDGRTSRGSIDDYWVRYGSEASDPYITGGWAQHTWGTAIGDYMKTSQSAYGLNDGYTSFPYLTSSAKGYCDTMPSAVKTYHGLYGIKLFYQARGYTVDTCYIQQTDNSIAGGFSYANYKAEINAGYPVLMNFYSLTEGHTMVGVGYDSASSTIYIHDTWTETFHQMQWGGSYAGMTMHDANIVHPVTPPLSLVSPSGVTFNTDPDYVWNSTLAPWGYQLRVTNINTAAVVINKTVDNSYCSGGVCRYNHNVAIAPEQYKFEVAKRTSSGGVGTYSAPMYFTTDTTPPNPPVLSKPVNGSQAIGTPTFTWLASATAKYYQVQYDNVNDGTGTYDYLSPDNLTVLTHKPTVTPSLMAPTYWYVRARDVAGNWSAWSAPFTVTVVPPVPVAPVLTAPVSGLVTNDNTPTLAWNTVAYANTYEIQIDTTYTFTVPLVQEVTGITTLNHTITALPDGKYYWRVRARNLNNAAGPWAAYRSFTIDTTPPAPPVLSRPLNGSQVIGTPTFTWLASATAKYYQVQYDDVNDGTTTYDYLSPDNLTVLTHKPTVTPSLMTPTYWYVRARDVAGNWSAWSAPFTVTVVPPVPVAPVLTAPVSGLVTNDNTPTLAWNTVAYANTYEIQIDTTYTFTVPLVQEVTGITTLNHTITALPDGKYYWRVRARNVNPLSVAGAWSAYRSFTIDTTGPNAPVLSQPLNNPPGIRTMPTFIWLAAATANAYEFQYDNETNFTNPVTYTSPVLTVLSHKPSLTMIVGTWYWRVRARDAVGNWGAWSAYRTLTILPPAVTNGNFEAGGASWAQYSSNGYELIITSLPFSAHSGSYAAWLGGDDDETSRLTQTGINMSGVRYLHFWYIIGSQDVCGYDYAWVKVNGVTVKTYNLCSSTNSSGWIHQVIDLLSYSGSIVSLEFIVETDSSLNSNFFLDDVSITNSSTTPVIAAATMIGSTFAEPKK